HQYQNRSNVSEGLSKPVTAYTLPHTAKKAVSNTSVLRQGMYRIGNRTSHTRAPQLPQTVRNINPRVSTSIGVNHNTNVSRPQLKSKQLKDKVLPNNSQIAKPITPPSETTSEVDSDPEQAQRDKDMQKNLALIAKYFKKIYKPTNNNLKTSSNSRNKNVDTTPQYKNDNQSGQFGNQRTMNVAGARENTPRIIRKRCCCANKLRKVFHFKLSNMTGLKTRMKRLMSKNWKYMAKIQEVPTIDTGTDSEPLEHVQNNTGYNMFANELQHSEQSESISNTCLVEIDDSNVIPDSPDMCDDYIQNDQNDVESDDECVALANLKLDTQNDSFIFVHELKQEMHADLKYVESLEKEIDELESDKAEFSNMYDMIFQECVECDCLAQQLLKQTESVSKEVHTELLQRFAKVEKHSISLEIALQKCKGKSVETKFDKPSVVRQLNAQRIPKPSVLGKPAPFLDSLERRYFSKTKSVPKTNVPDGLSKPVTAQTLPQTARKAIVQLFLFIVDSGCTKHMTGNLKLLCNFVEKFLGYSNQSKGYRVYNKRTRLIFESIHICFDEIKEMSETSIANDTSGLVPQRQMASDYENSDPVPQLQNVSYSADAHVPSQQQLDLLFGPLYDEFFNAGSNPQDTQPTTNIQYVTPQN
nr:hypothetical protein [Tanacetum cinerariifolium]